MCGAESNLKVENLSSHKLTYGLFLGLRVSLSLFCLSPHVRGHFIDDHELLKRVDARQIGGQFRLVDAQHRFGVRRAQRPD